MINTQLYNQHQARLETINKEINKRIDYRYTGDKEKSVEECSKLYAEMQDIELEIANLQLEPENIEIIPKSIPHKSKHKEKVRISFIDNNDDGRDWIRFNNLEFNL